MATECVLIVILSGSCCCVLRLCLSWSVLVLLLCPVCLGLCVSPVSFPLCFVSVLVLLMRPVFAFLFSNPFASRCPHSLMFKVTSNKRQYPYLPRHSRQRSNYCDPKLTMLPAYCCSCASMLWLRTMTLAVFLLVGTPACRKPASRSSWLRLAYKASFS